MRAIVQSDNPILREQAKPVPERMFGTDELMKLIADMSEALDQEPDGVALAAPQVGESLRLFIVRMDRTRVPEPGEVADEKEEKSRKAEVEVYINPEIVRRSRKKQEVDEGCLSVRGTYGHTKRAERATIKARAVDGTKLERGAGGLLAQIFQHEVDHLNGILFIDDAIDLFELKHDAKEVDHAA